MTQLLLTHVRFLDVRTGAWREDQSVLVEDKRIKEVSDRAIRAPQARALKVCDEERS